MSCDFGVWFPDRRLTDAEAGQRYVRLCESQVEGEVVDHPSVQAFYAELTGLHPEIAPTTPARSSPAREPPPQGLSPTPPSSTFGRSLSTHTWRTGIEERSQPQRPTS
jgi:hypothetical protein